MVQTIHVSYRLPVPRTMVLIIQIVSEEYIEHELLIKKQKPLKISKKNNFKSIF